MSSDQFALRLLQLGIEIALRKSGRVRLWPNTAWNALPESDKEFIREHHAELQMMVRDGLAPRLPEKHPGFPANYDGNPLYRSSGNLVPHGDAVLSKSPDIPVTTEPEPVVWTRDYSRRITAQDVINVFGKVPTVNTRKAYEHTRDALAQKVSQQRIAERYQQRGISHNTSIEKERYES